MPLVIYLATCLLIGALGRHRKLGFWGYFFGSIVLSPIVGALLVVASDRRALPQPPPAVPGKTS